MLGLPKPVVLVIFGFYFGVPCSVSLRALNKV